MNITQQDYWQGRDHEYRNELTLDIVQNSEVLIAKVNALLTDLEWTDPEISSGWRPRKVNKRVGGSPRSYHIRGMAIDLVDDKRQGLNKLISSHWKLLKKYGLWMEDGRHTRGKWTNWVHLDTGDRPNRERRIFRP